MGRTSRFTNLRFMLTAALALGMALEANVQVMASDRAAESVIEEIFAIRVRSYPVRRWAEEAAMRYQRQGVNAFVALPSESTSPPRYLLYLGKFTTETEADQLARSLASAQVISSSWRIETVSQTLCRHRQALCDKAQNAEKDDVAKKSPRRLARLPKKASSGKKPPDHFRLIRSILGGAGDPGKDEIIEIDTSTGTVKRTGPSSSEAAPSSASPFDLVPVTDP